MNYHVEFSKRALRELKKMDRSVASLITGWIRKNLEGCEDPRVHGKPLTGNLREQWRYRVGDYRLLAKIEDDRVLILILQIGHRNKIYK